MAGRRALNDNSNINKQQLKNLCLSVFAANIFKKNKKLTGSTANSFDYLKPD